MFPFIVITEQIKIPLYATIFIIGFFIAVYLARKMAPRLGGTKEDVTYAAAYAAIGILIGAKLMYFFTKLPNIITKFDSYLILFKEAPLQALEYIFGGLVFYGGLLGGIMGVLIYCKQYKVPYQPLLDIFAPLIPFVHGFGRLGCFCSGCCYGIEYHGIFCIQFPYNAQIPELSEVPRVPVQLIEAGFNFIVFGILYYIANKRTCKRGRLMGVYLIYYTIVRFFLEMLRGDKIRGGVGILSTSQLISIVLIPIGIYLLTGRMKEE